MSRKVFETWPVKEVPMTCIGHPDTTEFFQCLPEDATAFGVYFRIDGEGPAEWVGDCPTAEAADAAVAKLNRYCASVKPNMNEYRAKMAAEAATAHLYGVSLDIADLEDGHITDLLVNLMHLCDRTVYSFDSLLESARDSYIEETDQNA